MVNYNDNELLKQLEITAERMGLRQRPLANALGITQGHLSKVLREEVPLSRGLSLSIRQFLLKNQAADPIDIEDGWIENIARAAQKSEDFRAGINAMIRLMHNASK